ncbi:MAG: hypothetical protein DRQ55_13145 [Planctomycetota bacterium]|nr:MAG: hypothetical protein DRQ55_13145 [Planctomycetota bacterium]
MWPDLSGDFRRGWLGHNGARYAQIARNYARDGLLSHGGAPRLDVAGAGPDAPDVYANHPPGVAWLTGALFSVTGVVDEGAEPGSSERAARLLSMGFSLAVLGLLFVLTRRVAGARAAGWAALFTAALPMTVIYGTHVEVQGPHVLAGGLLVLLAYTRWREGGSLLPWLGAVLLASAFDWFGLYYAAGCAVHAALAPPRRLGAALGLGAVVSAVFGGWVLWLGQLPGMTPGLVFGAAGVRVDGGSGALQQGRPSLAQELGQRWGELSLLLPGLPLLLALALALLLLPRLLGRRAQPCQGAAPGSSAQGASVSRNSRPAHAGLAGLSRRWLLGLLLAPPVLHSIVFPAGLAVHNYWVFALPPALALAAALLLERRAGRAALPLGLVLAAAWVAAVSAARLPEDPLPAMVGRALSQVPVGELVLTNYDANPLRFGHPGDSYDVRLPEVTFYSDRAVRGRIDSPGRLAQARARLPAARWFLLAPFPAPPDQAALERALVQASAGPAQVLSQAPVVRLFPLAP